jgi:pyruvate formate lyase activating enzyme
VYGKAAAVALDPVEKKPLHHFHPGREILSAGTVGCNLRCPWCQNHHLVEGTAPLFAVTPEGLVAEALRAGSVGLAYTYNEPTVWFEFVLDCCRAAKAAGLANVLVTNGFIEEGPLAELLPLVDGANVDLKTADPALYRRIGGGLPGVERTIRSMAAAGVHVEVTSLLVTGASDGEGSVRGIVDFLAETDPEIPLHLSRYFPSYRYDAPPTGEEALLAAYRVARERLPYVYVGNIHLGGTEDTLCPGCGAAAVRRQGYSVDASGLDGRNCRRCGRKLRFVV